MKRGFLFLLMLALLILQSCQPGKVYESHIKMDRLSWNRFELIEFEVPIDDASAAYDIFIAIRHIPEIPFKSIDINCTMYTPCGEIRSLDYSIKLQDADGNLRGEGLGDLFDLEAPLRKGFKFLEPGICRFEFENKMSKMETPGIIEIGLIIKKTKKQT